MKPVYYTRAQLKAALTMRRQARQDARSPTTSWANWARPTVEAFHMISARIRLELQHGARQRGIPGNRVFERIRVIGGGQIPHTL